METQTWEVGKFEIGDDLLVHRPSNNIEGLTTADFEEKINEALSKHISNSSDYYRDDTDLISPNDTNTDFTSDYHASELNLTNANLSGNLGGPEDEKYPPHSDCVINPNLC